MVLEAETRGCCHKPRMARTGPPRSWERVGPPRSWERQEGRSPEPSERVRPGRHLDFGSLASRTVSECMSVVLTAPPPHLHLRSFVRAFVGTNTSRHKILVGEMASSICPRPAMLSRGDRSPAGVLGSSHPPGVSLLPQLAHGGISPLCRGNFCTA